MLAQILGAVRLPSLPSLDGLGPLARASSASNAANSADAVVHETLETCTVHRNPDGTSITRCEERRRVLASGVEIEVRQTTSTRPAAGAGGAANNPADAQRGALGRASPSAPLALDPRSSQMLDELFATATEMERVLTARGVLLDTRRRGPEPAAHAPDSATSCSGAGAGGAGSQEAAQPGLLRRWWGRTARGQVDTQHQQQGQQQQQQQQQRWQQPSLGAMAAAHGADAQAVL
ncbi:hypothetical protein Rsub_07163 [Raphidocelis subcapitata]|uniref:Uncharacterized protein n=1 Tax=Raphidocelis subcapitata TaxID=307507 RepID=A0A2V0P2U0_9CHLO|nr:hypothetical protein Rsub_07163 [Raphidocelis subcapitata]|eukprot:GBF94176.1 hypothetical protein Rsub_07163 [Raphidocelis subcapitata]